MIFRTWKNKDPPEKECFKSKEIIPINVYDEGGELRKSVKRFHWVHYFLKYKLVVPVIYLTRKLLGKRLVTEIPNRAHFKYVKMFDEAINEAHEEWARLFLDTRHKDKPRTKPSTSSPPTWTAPS